MRRRPSTPPAAHAGRRRALTGAAATLATLSVPSLARAADAIGEHTLRFAFVQTMDSHWGAGATRFAELVESASGGRMKVKPYPNGTLGGDQQLLSAMQGGILDMAMMGSALLVGPSREFSVLDLPYLFRDEQEASAVLDGEVGRRLVERLVPKQIIGLSFWEHGYRNLTNSRRAIARADDIRGLKIRTLQVPIYLDMMSALGATAVPLPLPELYTALENRTVDGQENPNVTIETNRYFETQKFLSTTRIVYNAILVMAGGKLWAKLNEAERAVLTDAAMQARVHQRQVARQRDAASLDVLRSKGMTVTELPQSERDHMRDLLEPVTRKYTAELGDDVVRPVLDAVQAYRKSTAGRA